MTTKVTVKPLPDVITITNATYRTGKQRLDITVTSSVISPNVVLTLRPYKTKAGGTYTPPNGTFTNTGGGIYTITLVGVPEPAIPPQRPDGQVQSRGAESGSQAGPDPGMKRPFDTHGSPSHQSLEGASALKPLTVMQGGPRRTAGRRATTSILVAAVMVSSLVISPAQSVLGAAQPAAPNANAAPAAFTPPVASTQFDMTGFLQAATLGGPGVGSHQGGTLTLDNQVVTVPAETIVILPANALSWQELFAQAPAPYGLPGNLGVTGASPTTGLAIADVPTPPYTYEVHVVGNREGDTYIAGLIDIAQQGLNSGAGYINFIDYSTGEFRVGGVLGDNTTGARVQLNDPTGRYGRTVSPDPRFTVDADNPTIASGTGFPMCIPRVLLDPTVAGNADDPLCPRATGRSTDHRRSRDEHPDERLPRLQGIPLPDARIQAPSRSVTTSSSRAPWSTTPRARTSRPTPSTTTPPSTPGPAPTPPT